MHVYDRVANFVYIFAEEPLCSTEGIRFVGACLGCMFMHVYERVANFACIFTVGCSVWPCIGCIFIIERVANFVCIFTGGRSAGVS